MRDERTCIVTCDSSGSRRWRRVFKTIHGFRERLRLPVVRCLPSRRRRAEPETMLRELVKTGEDHVLVIGIGSAEKTDIAVMSIGRPFSAIERNAVVA